MGLPGPSSELLRRLRLEGGELCARGRLPPGTAPLLRRGLITRTEPAYGGAWCLRLRKKKKRRKARS